MLFYCIKDITMGAISKKAHIPDKAMLIDYVDMIIDADKGGDCYRRASLLCQGNVVSCLSAMCFALMLTDIHVDIRGFVKFHGQVTGFGREHTIF